MPEPIKTTTWEQYVPLYLLKWADEMQVQKRIQSELNSAYDAAESAL